MKKITLIFVFLLAHFAVQSQIVFRQGYFLIDTSGVTIYSDINYVLNIQDSIITLPQRQSKIKSVETTSEGLRLVLDNGDIARYKTDPNYGEIFYIVWSNGRMVFWTKQLQYFNINLTK
jgi:hypothetical protein